MRLGFRRAAGEVYGLLIAVFVVVCLSLVPGLVQATPFTTTVPGTGVALPTQYPQAGGVAIVMTGVNGNIYYQFSDPTGAFVGYQNNGSPVAFRGNPFTINNPIALECGFRSCTDYFGGAIARIDIRFTAQDGDTSPGDFDFNNISLRMNGFDVGNWSAVTTDRTNPAGTTSFGMGTGFANNTISTGWFSSTNPALLANLLTTGRTTTQVFDSDPNDNYWDFSLGPPLGNESLRTIAPGYEMDKILVGGATTFTGVGQVLTYRYTIRNIGSVDITNIGVVDNRIPSVTCPSPASLPKTAAGGTLPELVCTGTYTVTQADVDAGTLTNIARASGTPAFGQLGQLTDQVTLTGPARNNNLTLVKTAGPSPFGAVGSTVNYGFTITNTGNTTLTNVTVTDPRIPALSCTFASIPPQTGQNVRICTGSYVVTQADVDAFAINGTQLANTATVTARGPDGASLTRTASRNLPGRAAAPAMTVTKTAVQASYAAVGQVLQFNIAVRNTGTVTWPIGSLTVTDSLAPTVNCPAVTVAPGATITCTANYTVTQANIDAASITNIANASVTVGGVTATGSDSETVPSVQTPALTILKRLTAGSPSPFTTLGQSLIYEYVLTNTGNVTLTAAQVTDNRIGVTCPATPILPNGTLTCTSAPFAVTQANLDDGSVTNTATASATGPAGPVASAAALLTVPGTQSPAMTIDKSAPDISSLTLGQLITYSYAVTNTGNVTLTDPVTIIDSKFPSPIACAPAPVAPAATVTCTATYTVTAADITAGFISNTAFARSGPTDSNTDTVTVPQSGQPGITLDKVADTALFTAAATTLNYTFTITNSGQRTITSAMPITINDPGVTLGTCVQPANLFPVGSGLTPTSYSCPATYITTQADVDAGEYVNTANASFTFVDPISGGSLPFTSPSSTATVPSTAIAGFIFTKGSADTYDSVGDIVNFSLQVTNSSTVTLSNVVISDPMLTGTCTFASIPPGVPANCSLPYTVTQADLDAEQIVNLATASAQTPTGAPVGPETATATVTIDPVAATRTMVLTKVPTPPTFTAVGQVISYVMEVENTGNLTLTNILVTDPALGTSCTIPTIAPGATDSSCAASYTISQADFDVGSYVNTAQAEGGGATTVTDAATVTGPARSATFTFSKTADGPFTAAGDVVTFRMRVQNTGNVSLSNVAISDTFFDPDLSCTIGTLLPGAVDQSCVGTYTVTQADVDAGSITNTAGLTANGVDDAPLTDTATALVSGPAATPGLSVSKTEDDASGSFGGIGSTETYNFSVTNTGNVTLTNVVINDPLLAFSCVLPDLAPGDVTTVCANNTPLQAILNITQARVDAGFVLNTVSVTADAARGTDPTAEDELTLPGPDQLPAISMVKTAIGGTSPDSPGDVISYEYVVTNTGNVTLTAPIRVTDDRTTVTCPALPSGGLAPLATLTCTATDAVSQADLDGGDITNTATANVNQPVRPSVTHPGGTAAVNSGPVTETVTAVQTPGLSIAKRITAGTLVTYDTPGNVISYTFTVRNAGNVTLTDPIVVDDTVIGVTDLACGTPPLAPGATATCTATYTVTQADIDAGSFINSATAETTFDGNPTTTPTPATATAIAVQTPDMTVDKSFVSINGNGNFEAGNIVSYDYTVTNSGNTTITGPITVSDNLIASVSCPVTDLAPGDQLVCTAGHTISVDDIALGSVTNVATATNGIVTSDPDSETVPIGADPALNLTKTATTVSFDAAGDTVAYDYVVTNQSSGPGAPAFLLANITINDDRIPAGITCDPASQTITNDAQLAVGESITCTGSYTVLQADMDAVSPGGVAGFVTNNATAETIFGATPVSSPPAQETVLSAAAPELTVAKSSANVSDPGQPAQAGDSLEYTIIVTNSGTVTIQGIIVDDPLLTGLTCQIGGVPAPANLTLAPAQMAECTGTYTVTQTDIDAQVLTNTATAAGSTPQGVPVDASDDDNAVLTDALPVLLIEKNLAIGTTPDGAYASVGQVVDFAIRVRNDGNVTLNDIEVTDDLVSGTCTIATLAPGAEDGSCLFSYTVTQADIDAGSILNTAFAVAQPANPDAATLEEEDQLNVDGPVREPGISLEKSADRTSFDTAGQTINYSFVVANTGNVTLTQPPLLIDDRIGPVSCPALPTGGLLPGAFITCTASDTVDQGDLDSGGVTNNAEVEMFSFVGEVTLTATDSLTVTASRDPAFTITKSPSILANAAEGDTITYSYLVENTGNVTLFDIALSDAHTSAAGTVNLALSGGGMIATLAPGDTQALTATYQVTLADINLGEALTNIVTGTADGPNGTTPPTASDDASVGLVSAAPSLATIKTVDIAPGPAAPGDNVVFRITVENTGNVTLAAPVLTDTLSRLDGSPITPVPTPVFASGDTGGDSRMAPGEVWTWFLAHTLTQADMDAGGLSNTVTARSQDPLGTPISDVSDNGTGDGDDPTPFAIAPAPALTVLKTVTTAPSPAVVGSDVIFTITVANTGNVTLSSIGLTDDLSRADGTAIAPDPTPVFRSGDGGTIGALDVAEVWTYTLTHRLTQADLDANGLSNTATATGTTPGGATISDVSDSGAGSGSTPTPFAITPVPALTTTKTFAAPSLTPGSTVTFTISVENTGTVSLRDVAIASDTLTRADSTALTLTSGPTFISASAGSASGALQVGEIATYTARYVLTQADIDAGGIANTATAEGRGPRAEFPVSDPSDNGIDTDGNTTDDPTVVSIPAAPAIGLVKSLTVPGTTFDAPGDVIGYDFTITNSGNVTLPGPFTVSDPLLGAPVSAVTCPSGPLAPGANLVCTGSYTVMQADIDRGFVTNTATARTGEQISPESTVTTNAVQDPGLTVDKQAVSVTIGATTTPGVPAAQFVTGAVVVYEYRVFNSGNTTITAPISVSDDLIAGVICPGLPAGGLAPGADLICVGSYTVQQTDVDAGEVTNLATATDGTTLSPAVTESIPTGGAPALTIDKVLTAGDGFAAVGDELTFTFTVSNSGDLSLRSIVTVRDDLTGDLACFTPTAGNPALNPGETAVCTAVYAVTQADIDAGTVVNVADATTQFGPVPTTITSPTDTATATATITPGVEIAKTASPSPFGTVGSVVTYSFAVTNTGNTTLRDLTVTDGLVTPAYTCTIARLDVGQTDRTCAMPFTIRQADVDAGGITNTATVAGVDALDNPVLAEAELFTPGPGAAPGIEVVKVASGGPVVPGAVITYDISVTNIGNLSVTGLTLDDTLTLADGTPSAPDAAPAFLSGDGNGNSVLDVGETWVYGAARTVTQADLDAGGFSNSVLATGFDPDGIDLSDISDDGDDGDGNTVDDPTESPVSPAPGLDVVKTVTTPGAAVGDNVVFQIAATNTGNVTLTGLAVADRLARADGTALTGTVVFLSGAAETVLAPGATNLWTLSHTLTQADIDVGGLTNSATVAGTGPGGVPVSDISDDGDDTDGNTVDDPTESLVARAPGLDVVKTVTTPGAAVGDNVVFQISATNSGNVSLTDVAVADTLTRADGAALTGTVVFLSGASETALAPGAVNLWTLSHTLTQADIDAGGLSNSATVTATGPGGVPVTDQSDDGDDGDGNTVDDPTDLPVARAPGLDVVKTVTTPGAAVGDNVVFQIAATNTGNVSLTGLTVTDTFTRVDGAALTADVTFLSGASANTLAPGDTNIWTMTHVLTQADIDAGGLVNSATVLGQTPGGIPVSDQSDDSDDSDGNTDDDGTELVIAPDTTMSLQKELVSVTRNGSTQYTVVYDLTARNDGNVTQADIQVADDLVTILNPATLVRARIVGVTGFGPDGQANTVFNGGSVPGLLAPGAMLAPQASGTITLSVRFDIRAGVPQQPNRARLTADRLPEPELAEAPPLDIDPALVTATKSVAPASAILGEVVTYTVTFTNDSTQGQTNLSLADDLPAGIGYVPGSARIDGADTRQPDVTGNALRWPGVDMAPAQTITLTYQARVTGLEGELTNRAYATDANGDPMSNIATATLRRAPEAVFDCGDVIGRVYDDVNMNGYQDGAVEPDPGAITDQTYDGDKGEIAALPGTTPAEPGLANIRLLTVDGTAITTDEYGRFHVPCALLPGGTGSNFTLKVDDRSLPTGYHMTTENPRTVRLTAGTVARMNFGAAIANVVDVDLMDAAFGPGTAAPTRALVDGIGQLVTTLRDTPSVLRLTYWRRGEPMALVRDRMDGVEALLRDAWAEAGRYRLLIERTVQEVQ